MKVLLVGGGAREHALAWKLTSDDPSLELLAAPGNPGMAQHGRCVAVNATDVPALVELARDERMPVKRTEDLVRRRAEIDRSVAVQSAFDRTRYRPPQA